MPKQIEWRGFVDLQVNGYLGIDFSDPALSPDAARKTCRALLAHGTAAFLPTIVTSAHDTYRRNLPLLASLLQEQEFAGRLLGLHLEGPFISPEPGARGVHNPAHIRPPDPIELDELIELSSATVKLITIAAEIPGADEFIRHAVSRGIAVSLGHQLANPSALAKAAESGATALTHLGNGIPAMIPRHENPLWAGMSEDQLNGMIITDGHHLPPPVIKCILRAKGIERSIVVSDAAPIAGMPPGPYHALGNDVILEASGRLYNPESGYLAGSGSTMFECMNHLAGLDILSEDELLRVGFLNPLKLIGLTPSAISASAPHIRYDPKLKTFFL